MDERSPFRRWKRFFGAFKAIDSAIEATGPASLSRAEHRRLTGDLFEMLCDADGDEERAEGICLLLDDAMAEALESLRLVPVTATMLNTTDVARAVAGLRRHEAERVRCLARGILGRWRASMESDLSRTRTALKNLSQIPEDEEHKDVAAPYAGDVRSDRPSTLLQADVMKQATSKIPDLEHKKRSPVGINSGGDREPSEKTGTTHAAKIPERPKKIPFVVASHRVRSDKTEAAKHKLYYHRDEVKATAENENENEKQRSASSRREKLSQIPEPPRKTSSVDVGCADGDRVRSEIAETAKRKLPEGCYREAEDGKRQRHAPVMVPRKPWNTHHTVKDRNGASYAAERRFSSLSHRRV